MRRGLGISVQKRLASIMFEATAVQRRAAEREKTGKKDETGKGVRADRKNAIGTGEDFAARAAAPVAAAADMFAASCEGQIAYVLAKPLSRFVHRRPKLLLRAGCFSFFFFSASCSPCSPSSIQRVSESERASEQVGQPPSPRVARVFLSLPLPQIKIYKQRA